jgi:hypothetical protein
MTARSALFSIAFAALTTTALLAQQPAAAPAQPRSPVPAPAPAQPRAPVPPAPAAAPAQPRSPVPPGQRGATPAPAAQTPAAQPREQPRRDGQPINIQVDVTITDQRGGGAPAVKKTVSAVTADGGMGIIRTSANYTAIGDVPLNVDIDSRLVADGKIRVHVNLQYELPVSSAGEGVPGVGSLRKTSLRENLSLVLENGKSIVAAQSADPVGDRQVTIEVKATVLR